VALFSVINYGKDTWHVHYAKARLPEDMYGRPVVPESDFQLTAEDWWHWRSLCGKDLIARSIEDRPVDCRACIKAYEAGRKKAEELAARFG
jgi:hypothetical protein